MARGVAIPIIDIGNDDTSSYTWGTSYTLGYSFSIALGSSVTFNALGVFDTISATRDPLSAVHVNVAGLSFSHEVGLWNSSGTLLASATVNLGDPTTASANTFGQWVYKTVAPQTLLAGGYTIGALYLANSDPVMVTQSAVIGLAGVTYIVGNYANGPSLTFPTGQYLSNEKQYFGPTLLSVPDGGATLMLLGTGLASLAALRRKFAA